MAGIGDATPAVAAEAPRDIAGIAWAPFLLVIAIVALAHAAIATRFGWHRDEFYCVTPGRQFKAALRVKGLDDSARILAIDHKCSKCGAKMTKSTKPGQQQPERARADLYGLPAVTTHLAYLSTTHPFGCRFPLSPGPWLAMHTLA